MPFGAIGSEHRQRVALRSGPLFFSWSVSIPFLGPYVPIAASDGSCRITDHDGPDDTG